MARKNKMGAHVRLRAGRGRWDMRVCYGPGDWRWEATGKTTKRAAEQMRADRQKQIDRGEVGLLDPFEESKGTPLMQLKDEFVKSLAGGGRAARYVSGVDDRLALAIQVMGARFVQDVTVQKVETFLTRLLTGDNMPPMKPRKKGGNPIPRGAVSATTRDRYAEALRSFGAWLLRTKRWGSNPFADLRAIAGDDDRTMEHRAWTPDEIGKLIEAATTRCVQQWAATHQGSKPGALATKLKELRADGWRRAVLYEFTAYTGLRLNECATLAWADVVLDGNEPSVTVKAKNSKNRKHGQSVPLVDWVVVALKELWQRNKAARVRENKPMLGRSDLVFDVNRGLLEALRKDACWAFGEELGEYDAQGRRTTFHGFRASTCTMLHRAGVALAVAVRIMRHADPKLTIETYAKLDALTDGHRELGKMARPKITAVPLTVTVAPPQVPPCSVPLEAAVGCSVPLAQAGSAIAARIEAPLQHGSTTMSAAASRYSEASGEWWALQESNLRPSACRPIQANHRKRSKQRCLRG